MEYVLYPKSEIDDRIKRLQSRMVEMDGAILLQSVDMCYFSGTAQDGLVYIPRDGEPVVMIKRAWREPGRSLHWRSGLSRA